MLIESLCEYYDYLEEKGLIIPEGYSEQDVHYVVSLNAEGGVEDIIDVQETVTVTNALNRKREVKRGKKCLFPFRKRQKGKSYLIDHRASYVFGLEHDNKADVFKVQVSGDGKFPHDSFVKTHLEFLENVDSPIANAFRKFLLNWDPEKELETPYVEAIKKDFDKSAYAFCLSGDTEHLLQDDPAVVAAWEEYRKNNEEKDAHYEQCAVTGEERKIARVHDKVGCIQGGAASGMVLVSYQDTCGRSYGREQSYNSNVSEEAMYKYTTALRYLLDKDSKHTIPYGDMTLVIWTLDEENRYKDFIHKIIYAPPITDEEGNDLLIQFMDQKDRFSNIADMEEFLGPKEMDKKYYFLGLKANNSRLIVEFFEHGSTLDLFWNELRFQKEACIGDSNYPLTLSRLLYELRKPSVSASGNTGNTPLATALFESILFAQKFPMELYYQMLRRVKIDMDLSDGREALRAGILKAVLIRNFSKEELTMGLNLDNQDPAYLCGRLFAIIEKIQKDASRRNGRELNKTVKNTFLSSAMETPGIILPRLVKRLPYYLKKVAYPVYFENMVEEITEQLDGYPIRLSAVDQGEFYCGYVHQKKYLYTKREKNTTEEEL